MIVVKTLCNICGKTFDTVDEECGVRVRKTMGYGSKYDGSRMVLDICTQCFDKIIEGCYISPENAEEE